MSKQLVESRTTDLSRYTLAYLTEQTLYLADLTSNQALGNVATSEHYKINVLLPRFSNFYKDFK